jgi:branched-chain amino acid transport system permease protein
MLGVGIALVTGVMRVINIAHGEFIVLAAMLGIGLSDLMPGVHPLLLLVPVAVVFFFVGYAVQAALINKVVTAPDLLAPILLTFGLSIMLRNLMVESFGADVRSLHAGGFGQSRIDVFGVSMGVLPLVTLALAILFFVGLQLLISRTEFGRVVRATADNGDVARLMGVTPARVYKIVMGMSLALAAVAGILLAMRATITPFSGVENLLIAFEVVVLGGFGSFWGALVGGIALGIAQVAGLKMDSNAGALYGHLLFFICVLLRPNGLFGVRMP